MYIAIGVIAIVVIAAVGAALMMGKGSNDKSVKVLLLKKTSSSVAYSPMDQEAVYNGSYSLSRYLYLYTDGVPSTSSSIYKWLSLIYNTTGQQMVTDAGFYPLQTSDLNAMKAQLQNGNNSAVTGAFTESGSTTMTEIAALWAQSFKQSTGITVTIKTPGSGAGIKDFYNKIVDVAQASRAMTTAEKATAAANGITVVEWKVAVDGLAIIVNKDNPVTTLTLSQLEGIFNGTYTNWNQVGGNDKAISLYGRDSASGSYASFKDLVLVNKENYTSAMLQFNTNALIVPEVESAVGAIGYVGIGFAKEASGTSADTTLSEVSSPVARVL
ncbi:MAG: PBP superfamily domain protein [Methanomassiliicoccales archaeon PtaU1.Bin124]|nr:MAG: PBP superfamily domain protein [Methanomassiliicoccales archaeon PtaU1.Bin124]